MAVGRFQVMALLQAARAHMLGLPRESAYSWGLNRAIFYAAAKRGFKGGGQKSGTGREVTGREGTARSRPNNPLEFFLGDEMAYRDPATGPDDPLFAIGGETQTPERFEKQIGSRFEGATFQRAWDQAVDYVQHFDRETLESSSRFFSDVYRPKRDEFAKQWSEWGSGPDQVAPKATPRPQSKNKTSR